jgi:uncharacterized protein
MSMQEERQKQTQTRRQASNARGAALPHTYPTKIVGDYPLLPDEQPTSTVRDSLYDLIPLGPREERLISTPAFLRLQKIKQLGFVYRVWPGATHTRYEHSLGCYHLAVRALRSLLQRGKNGGLFTVTGSANGKGGNGSVNNMYSSIQTLVVAALLHDIGHYPFSHTIEELGYPIMLHEQVGRSLIEKSEIAAIIERDYRLSPERVADMIDPPRSKTLPDNDELLAHLLSGALDVDKLDYLPRDARACNVPYGGVDVSRLLGALRVYDRSTATGEESKNGPRRIVVTHKGISPLHSLLHARQEMFDNIYWHHTSRAFQIMLVRAVQEALLAGTLEAAQLVGSDDASLLALLSHERMPASTRALAEDLDLRRPYKGVIEVSRMAGRLYHRLDALFWDANRRRHVEQELAQELATALDTVIADYEVLFDIPRPEKWEMDVLVTFGKHPPIGMSELETWVQATGLQPDDLARYEQHQRRIRVVVPQRLRDLLQARKDDVLLPVLEKLV